jgi:hypothetical protein
MKPSLLLMLFLLGTVGTASAAPILRYALAVGANNGGPGRANLKFASSDAKSFVNVLESLGSLDSSRQIILTQPDPAELRAACAKMAERIRTERPPTDGRVEFIAYYSGHSDEEGLRLGQERMSYTEFRALLDAIPADVRIAIVDGCASGSLIRLKGGTLRPAFTVDQSARMKGYAFLTSSAHDEAAQESDRIGGSFFTYYLISGLRGAADGNDDSRVTLNEAYEYSFRETLRLTERSGKGAQHPGYDIEMRGTGEVVLTDLRSISSRLRFPPELKGRIFVRDEDGRLVAEIAKARGKAGELGVEAGNYNILLQANRKIFQCRVAAQAGAATEVEEDRFVRVASESSEARGVGGWDDHTLPPYPVAPFNVGVMPSLSLQGSASRTSHGNFSLNLIYSQAATFKGAQLGFLANVLEDEGKGLQFASLFNWNRDDFSGFQASGLMGYTRGRLRGAQASYLLNIAGGGLDGIQNGWGFSYANGESGFAQITLLGNFAQGPFHGVQFGAANFASGMRGAQLGALNVGGSVTGFQLSLLNAAMDVKGVQVGVVNLSNSLKGTSIGLINLSRKDFTVDVWTEEAARTYLGWSAGSGPVYSMAFLEVDPGDDESGSLGLSLGMRHGFGRFSPFADAAAVWWIGDELVNKEDGGSFKFRIGSGIRLFWGVSLIAGGSYNRMMLDDGMDWIVPNGYEGPFSDGRQWLGAFAGIRYSR